MLIVAVRSVVCGWVKQCMCVGAVDRLRGTEESKWLVGVIVEQHGVKLAVQMQDGSVIWRHADRVRRRAVMAGTEARPPRVGRWDEGAAVSPPCEPPRLDSAAAVAPSGRLGPAAAMPESVAPPAAAAVPQAYLQIAT